MCIGKPGIMAGKRCEERSDPCALHGSPAPNISKKAAKWRGQWERKRAKRFPNAHHDPPQDTFQSSPFLASNAFSSYLFRLRTEQCTTESSSYHFQLSFTPIFTHYTHYPSFYILSESNHIYFRDTHTHTHKSEFPSSHFQHSFHTSLTLPTKTSKPNQTNMQIPQLSYKLIES